MVATSGSIEHAIVVYPETFTEMLSNLEKTFHGNVNHVPPRFPSYPTLKVRAMKVTISYCYECSH